MSKVKIKGIDPLQQKINDMFHKVRKSHQMNHEIGKFTVERIKGEIRRGKPLNDKRAFPALADSTVSRRNYLGAYNPTHPAFKPNRSNLTLTGQLVDAIVYRLKDGGAGIEVEVNESIRDPYIISRGGETGDIKSNLEVVQDLKGRGFILFTAKGIDSEPRVLSRINNIVKKFLRRAIKINFNS